jgi:CHAD domain-containing protein
VTAQPKRRAVPLRTAAPPARSAEADTVTVPSPGPTSLPPSPPASPPAPEALRPAVEAAPRRRRAHPFPVSAAAALHGLLGDWVAALRADLAPALGGDAEAVHRMRTTLRRMRAALRLFRPLLPRSAAAQDRALRRLCRALSAARDWDVFLDETLARAEADGVPTTAILPLRRAGETRRRSAYAALRRRLGGPAVAETSLALLGWLDALGPGTGLARPLADVAPRLVRRLARKARRRARRLDGADPAALHALRKSVRRLRDAMDALATATPARRAGGAPRTCRKLADRLGRLNDAGVAAGLARRLAGPRGAGTDAAAALSDWAARAERRALRRVPKAWKALRRSPPFRRA